MTPHSQATVSRGLPSHTEYAPYTANSSECLAPRSSGLTDLLGGSTAMPGHPSKTIAGLWRKLPLQHSLKLLLVFFQANPPHHHPPKICFVLFFLKVH